ncbi:hypothetical protein [Roseitranquillus sediminis]|nr:hypothetical protein [Roseitranquillus sediminis]MBM9594320.1 hypothetical protein [Roseitranquillus sediminis]
MGRTILIAIAAVVIIVFLIIWLFFEAGEEAVEAVAPDEGAVAVEPEAN